MQNAGSAMTVVLPWWAQLLVGLVADVAAMLVGSYATLGKVRFRERMPAAIASAILGFILAPVFVGISGIVGLSGISSALLLVMWSTLLKGLVKLEWPNSVGLGLACVVLTYALVEWCGFTTLLTPWWQMFV